MKLMLRGLLLPVLLVVLAGCAGRLPVVELPPELHLQPAGKIVPDGPFAWHPDGFRYAVADGGLTVRQLDGGRLVVDHEAPMAVAWSPTGYYLAAAFPRSQATTVRIYGSDGAPLADWMVEGSVRDLAWASDDELLLAAVAVKSFSFGANYTVTLYQWHQNEEMKESLLADTSPLKQNLEAMGAAVFDTVHLQISPYHDEILFTRLLTPPNVDLHYQLVVRHLGSGSEKAIAKIPYGSAGGRYLGQEDKIFFSDAQYQSILRSIWGTEAYETYPAGLKLEVSPGGRYMLIDNLLLRGRDQLLRFDRVERAAFSPDGARLLFSSGRSLYLLSNLEDAAVVRTPASPRLMELRRWRSDGLLTPQDFVKYERQIEKK